MYLTLTGMLFMLIYHMSQPYLLLAFSYKGSSSLFFQNNSKSSVCLRSVAVCTEAFNGRARITTTFAFSTAD